MLKTSILAILVSLEQFINNDPTDSFSSKHMDDFYFEAMDEGSAQSISSPAKGSVAKLKSIKTPDR